MRAPDRAAGRRFEGAGDGSLAIGKRDGGKGDGDAVEHRTDTPRSCSRALLHTGLPAAGASEREQSDFDELARYRSGEPADLDLVYRGK